jgi:selenocysteine lyase/cysteine desulfurase
MINGTATILTTRADAADRLRAQIPALRRTINGVRPVYLDAPGGTQMPQPAVDAMANYIVRARQSPASKPMPWSSAPESRSQR